MRGFTEKLITLVFTLGKQPDGTQPTFSNGQNIITLSGHRVLTSVAFSGAASQPQAQISIYGMNISDMNALASYGNPYFAYKNNSVEILAGDVNGVAQAFHGTISDAFIDFTQMPDVCFNVMAFTGLFAANNPIAPVSFKGSVSVATVMAVLASQVPLPNGQTLTLENNGVTAVLSNPYFSGCARDMIAACATAARINRHIDGAVLSIWPQGGYRTKIQGITLSPTTGLIGYPSYTYQGIVYKSIFTPGQIFGSLVTIQSSLQAASGQWAIFGMNHTLEAQVPGGEWCSDVVAYKPGNLLGPTIS